MEKLMILNGSPRAPRSNSKEYAAIFAEACARCQLAGSLASFSTSMPAEVNAAMQLSVRRVAS